VWRLAAARVISQQAHISDQLLPIHLLGVFQVICGLLIIYLNCNYTQLTAELTFSTYTLIMNH
jgi:hypothetical protein